MRKGLGVVVVCLALGCSGDDDPSLEGTWGADEDDGCASALIFKGDSFEEVYACALEDGTFGYESYRGTFSESGGKISVHITAASCPDAEAGTTTLDYEFVGKRLRVSTSSGITLYERLGAPKGSGSADYGCYDGDTFEPSPVRSIR